MAGGMAFCNVTSSDRTTWVHLQLPLTLPRPLHAVTSHSMIAWERTGTRPRFDTTRCQPDRATSAGPAQTATSAGTSRRACSVA